MSYKGKYRVHNKQKYKGDVTNVVYRSMWERYCFKWCDHNPSVEKWSSEQVVVPYLCEVDNKVHRYFVDLWIRFTDGNTYLIEVKPDKETRQPKKQGKSRATQLREATTYIVNQNKWKAAEEFAADRGWKFKVWTEHTLEKMGIKPKSTKRLKPLRSKK